MKSYTSLLYHVVFSTKERAPLITAEILEEIRKLAKNKSVELKSEILILNGYQDHIHILCRIHKSVAVAEFVRQIKGLTSHEMENFQWQTGYSAFSVDKFSEEKIFEYIKNQEQHHSVKTLDEELNEFP